MSKIVKFNIETCSDCPYNKYREYSDIGTDFGMSYYCTHPEYPNTDTTVVGNKQLNYQRGRTKVEIEHSIRVDCPLK